MLTVEVNRYERGDPRGRADRDFVGVLLKWQGKVVAKQGFSASWQPHTFHVMPHQVETWDAELHYLLTDRTYNDHCVRLFDFDADDETREAIREWLRGY